MINVGEIKKEVEKLARKYGLKLLLVYGSVAKNEARRDSDVDVAFRSENKVDLLELMADLVKVLKFGKIDLVDLDTANPLLLSQIVSDYIVLFGEKSAVNSLEVKAFKRFVDYKPYFDDEREFVNQFYNVL